MAEYGADEFGFPLTSVQRLRRDAGYKPNEGTLGLNFHGGEVDAREEHYASPAKWVPATPEQISDLFPTGEELTRRRIALKAWCDTNGLEFVGEP